MPTRFERDTAVVPQGDGRYTATIDPAWRVERPNGGYVGAIVLRAVTTELADPARPPRSMSIHYLRPPEDGPVTVDVTVERSGRRMANVSAHLRQGDRSIALALVAAGVRQDGLLAHDDAVMPDVAPPDELEPIPRPPFPIPIRDNFDTRRAIGPVPFVRTDEPGESVTGGWIRLVDPGPIDAEYLVQVADAWTPAIFGVTQERVGVPTVDLTVHFRQAAVSEDPWLLVRFRTRLAADGYLEEDGEIWDRDGHLLAQSRQLAVLV